MDHSGKSLDTVRKMPEVRLPGFAETFALGAEVEKMGPEYTVLPQIRQAQSLALQKQRQARLTEEERAHEMGMEAFKASEAAERATASQEAAMQRTLVTQYGGLERARMGAAGEVIEEFMKGRKGLVTPTQWWTQQQQETRRKEGLGRDWDEARWRMQQSTERANLYRQRVSDIGTEIQRIKDEAGMWGLSDSDKEEIRNLQAEQRDNKAQFKIHESEREYRKRQMSTMEEDLKAKPRISPFHYEAAPPTEEEVSAAMGAAQEVGMSPEQWDTILRQRMGSALMPEGQIPAPAMPPGPEGGMLPPPVGGMPGPGQAMGPPPGLPGGPARAPQAPVGGEFEGRVERGEFAPEGAPQLPPGYSMAPPDLQEQWRQEAEATASPIGRVSQTARRLSNKQEQIRYITAMTLQNRITHTEAFNLLKELEIGQ